MKTMPPDHSVLYSLSLKIVVRIHSLKKYPEKISSTSDSNTSFHKDLTNPQDHVDWGEVEVEG